MHGLLVIAGLLLLNTAALTLALPILDFTGVFAQLFPGFPATPEMASRLALVGAACLAVGWMIYLKRGGA